MENRIAKEFEEQQASNAIDWIDSLPRRIALILTEGAIRFNLDVTKAATGEAMELITEALGDLLHKDRCRKVAICGEPIDSFSTIHALPNKALAGHFMPGMSAVRASEGL